MKVRVTVRDRTATLPTSTEFLSLIHTNINRVVSLLSYLSIGGSYEFIFHFIKGVPVTGKILDIRVSNCANNFPCILRRGTSMTIEFDYVPCNFIRLF